VDETIAILGIEHLLAKKPSQLAVGERQRASIARAIAHEPTILLADEPTAALDPSRAVAVMRLLIDLVRGHNGIGVIVTHDWELIRRLNLRNLEARLNADGSTAVFIDAV